MDEATTDYRRSKVAMLYGDAMKTVCIAAAVLVLFTTVSCWLLGIRKNTHSENMRGRGFYRD